MEKIACVTGGTGLIGSKIAQLLIELGFTVKILTRKNKKSKKNLQFIKGDILLKNDLVHFLKDAQFVFHCAAELNDNSKMWDVNVLATEMILDICKFNSVKFFCFMSSAGVVGRVKNKKVINEKEYCTPQNNYEKTKYIAEQLVGKGIEGASIVILRPTNVIDEKKTGQISLIINNRFYNKLKIFLKGRENSHIVHAQDVARAAVYFINTNFISPECFFISQDCSKLNSLAMLYKIYLLKKNNKSLINVKPYWCLPIWCIYICRLIIGKGGNMGNVQYSTNKIISYGFEYKYSLEKIMEQLK